MNAAALSALIAKRLPRLRLWLCLAASWFVAHALARVSPQAAHRTLKTYARYACILLVADAFIRMPARPRPREHRPIAMRRPRIRGAAGPALRRALRRGSLAERAARICAVLAAPESWIAAIMRRLRRRFDRLGRLPAPRRVRCAARRLAFHSAGAVDSS
jgi:hypothetical protein